MKKKDFGPIGYYGICNSDSKNKIVKKLNMLVDQYNNNINKFDTYEEQIKFIDEIESKMSNFIKKIILLKNKIKFLIYNY
jgi:hypothetical protein